MKLHFIDYMALSPLWILLAGGLALLLVECFIKRGAALISAVTFIAALVAAFYAPFTDNELLSPWLAFDAASRLFTSFFLVIGLACTGLAGAFFREFKAASEGEFYFLLVAGVFGLVLIGASADFLTLFLGIETLSLSLYVLCGYMKKWTLSSEASIKYFFMGSLAAAFLLYGIALIYGATGETHFATLLSHFKKLNGSDVALFWAGIAFITLALSFEAAIVPFHVWAPDVYEGASNPVTAFMAVGTKVGAFAAFARIFLLTLPLFDPLWNDAMAYLAYPTLIYANFVALRQTEMRRFFAYSGIAHAGFLLIPLAVGTQEGLSALMFYLVIYGLATLACFAALAFLDKTKEGVALKDLRGLFYRSPLLAALLSLGLLTLAGIPPTIGFFAKFYVFKIAYAAGFIGLVIVGLLTSILAAFYYLRFVAVLFADAPQESFILRSWPALTLGLVLLVALVALSFYPTPLVNLLAMLR